MVIRKQTAEQGFTPIVSAPSVQALNRYANCTTSQQLALSSFFCHDRPITGAKRSRPSGMLSSLACFLLLPGAFDLQGTHFCFLFALVDFHSLTLLSPPSDPVLVGPSLFST